MKKKEPLKKKNVSIPLRILSSLLFIPFLLSGLSAQDQIYYADTLSIATFERPVAVVLDETDTLLYYDPLTNVFARKYAFTRSGDSILISGSDNVYTCVQTADKDILNCSMPGLKFRAKRMTSRPGFINRPQTDTVRTAYIEEFHNFYSTEDSIILSASLMLPQIVDAQTPCVIFVAGSGPHDRDETIFGHKIFKVMAMHLVDAGIASFRYDKRGVGESEGEFSTAVVGDFVSDAEGAIQYLRKLNRFSQIGVLGHSEGGMVVSDLGRNKSDVDFYIIVGGPAAAIDELLYDQSRLVMESSDVKPNTVDVVSDFNRKVYKLMKRKVPMDSLPDLINPLIDELRGKLDSVDAAKPEYSKMQLYMATAQTFYSDYFHSFMNFPADENFKYMEQPILAIYGGKDLQVSARLNMPALEAQLKEAPTEDYRIINFPDCNHLMQKSETGNPMEYMYIETTVEEEVLETIVEWISRRVD